MARGQRWRRGFGNRLIGRLIQDHLIKPLMSVTKLMSKAAAPINVAINALNWLALV